jgi:hypothetical protein
MILFVLLSALPSAREPRVARLAVARPAPPFLWVEKGMTPALLGSLLAAGLVWFGTKVLVTYGTTLFLGLPCLQGMIVSLLVGRRDFGVHLRQFLLSAAFSMLLLLAFASEGLLCILMVSPLWLAMGLLGVALGRALVAISVRQAAPVLLVMPLSQWLEQHGQQQPAVFETTTAMVVHATPAVVWKYLIEFPELPPPTELPFRLGIAWPVSAAIKGRGPGAIRRCSFSTGDFVEPIEVWEEPHLLHFSVLQNPQPMVEWNPFHDQVDAAHLHGYFQARRGQFALSERPDGTTLLAGTTWYSHGLWPETYWRWWSDAMVHAIHRRVLTHIARCAERDRR